MSLRFAFLLSFASILLSPAAARAQLIEETVEEHRDDVGEIDRRGGDFVHRASGYVFPGDLGGMPARKTYTYSPGDASVYYTLLGGGNGDPWLSLYVYPATRPIADEIRDIEAAIAQRMPGQVTRPPNLPPLPAGVAEKWYDATADGEALLTGYRISTSGNWYIKVRLSIPRSGGATAIDRAWKALGAVPWTVNAPAAPVSAASAAGAAR